jgi:hypothetical protein
MDLKPAGDFEQHLEAQPHSADSPMCARPSAIFLCCLLQSTLSNYPDSCGSAHPILRKSKPTSYMRAIQSLCLHLLKPIHSSIGSSQL